ncbi:MAG TPA: nucleoside-diphosphate sugar epimerase/dehydratase [Panacibacter sp.]|nr:nucleoside-diphosphate sugar epimerase/dehydratase [Panacibacter sp.]HNP46577.1 nucleoside-diphosphate sugar epimerase/dehydratase [Panacibacter sp.]
MNEFRKFLLKNRITPKWVIFALDLFICILSYIYANYLLNDFKIVFIEYENLWKGMAAIALVSSVCFFIFKTYQGIIRFSELHEAVTAISAVFCSFAVLLLVNIFLLLVNETPFIPYSVLFVYFLSASFVICGYRVLVKTLYNSGNEETEAVNVIIFGAGNRGSMLHKVIGKTYNNGYRVIAFIDDDEMLVGKNIDGIPIHALSQIVPLVKSFRVKFLFFSRSDVDVTVKNKIVDYCLDLHVKVLNIPALSGLIDGHLNLNHVKEVRIEELLGRPAIELSNPDVISYITNKKVLITGAAGSIGSELARQIAAMSPLMLIVCDQLETGLYNLEYELQKDYQLADRLKYYIGDVKDAAAMEQMFRLYRPDVIFHAAAYKHVPVMESHPSEAICNNVQGTRVVAELAEKYLADRFLLVSTDKAIRPTNVMGASKRIAEMYCNTLQNSKRNVDTEEQFVYRMAGTQRKTKFITTRFGNVLASNGSVIPRFREQIAKGGPVTVTHPEVIRYFMTIREACSLFLEAVTMGKGGEIFLFDMGEPVKILDLAKKMILLAGYEPGKDVPISFTGLRPGEKLYEELLNQHEKVIPTHHKKILIAKNPDTDSEPMQQEIQELIAMATTCNDEEVIRLMKRIVPDYISNNSVYELFDSTYESDSPGVAASK